jgi:TolB-like protein/Tfp pilus assembly protein PilF
MGQATTFGPYRLEQGVLLRGAEPVDLPPKAVELLAALLERGGRVVPKDELFDALWPDVVVEEGNLAKLVFLLRKELGESAIETIPKRGYRFALRPEQTVAVLPFADLSEGHTEASLCEGISEEILSALARVPGISVFARSTSFSKRSGATVLVEGSIRRAGGTLRIAARLVDAQSGLQRWSQVFDRPARDVFAVQGEIARAVAQRLHPAATLPEPPKAIDLEAYELYLQGRYFWNRRPGEVVWQALERFEKAIEREPRFAAAWAAVGDIYATLGSWEAGVLEPADSAAKAQHAAARALELDPDLADAHTTVAYTALHYRRAFRDAEDGFRRALRLNPRYAGAHHWYSHSLVAEGRFAESLEESRAALAVDPLNLLLSVHLSWHHFMARDAARALEQAERVVAMDKAYHWGHFFVGWCAEALGSMGRAVEEMREAVRCSQEDPVMVAGLARALAAAGDRCEAMARVAELEKRRQGRALFAYEEALVHLALGDRETAFALLQRAGHDRSGWLAYLDVDPRLDEIRDDERFVALRSA